jgi:hypothetical protein
VVVQCSGLGSVSFSTSDQGPMRLVNPTQSLSGPFPHGTPLPRTIRGLVSYALAKTLQPWAVVLPNRASCASSCRPFPKENALLTQTFFCSRWRTKRDAPRLTVVGSPPGQGQELLLLLDLLPHLLHPGPQLLALFTPDGVLFQTVIKVS